MDAESILSYYESKDFEWDYIDALIDQADDDHLQKLVIEICEDEFGITIFAEQARKIVEYVYENINEFVKRFSGYYVGRNCLDSISFGEQEEQLFDIYNHETGRAYELHEIQPIYEEAGFYVNEEYAYLDLSGEGLCVKITREQVLNILTNANI